MNFEDAHPKSQTFSKISPEQILAIFKRPLPCVPSLETFCEKFPEAFSKVPFEPENFQKTLDVPSSEFLVEVATTPRVMKLVPQKRIVIPKSPFTTSGYVEDSALRVWYYLDESEIVQGPFTSLEMDHWFDNGFLFNELLIRIREKNNFAQLIHLFGQVEVVNVYKSVPAGFNDQLSAPKSANQALKSSEIQGEGIGSRSGGKRESIFNFGFSGDLTGNTEQITQQGSGNTKEKEMAMQNSPKLTETMLNSPHRGQPSQDNQKNQDRDEVKINFDSPNSSPVRQQGAKSPYEKKIFNRKNNYEQKEYVEKKPVKDEESWREKPLCSPGEKKNNGWHDQKKYVEKNPGFHSSHKVQEKVIFVPKKIEPQENESLPKVVLGRKSSDTFEMLKASSEYYEITGKNLHEPYESPPQPQKLQNSEQKKGDSSEKPKKLRNNLKLYNHNDYEEAQERLVNSSLGLLDLEDEHTTSSYKDPTKTSSKNLSATPSPLIIEKVTMGNLYDFSEDIIYSSFNHQSKGNSYN